MPESMSSQQSLFLGVAFYLIITTYDFTLSKEQYYLDLNPDHILKMK